MSPLISQSRPDLSQIRVETPTDQAGDQQNPPEESERQDDVSEEREAHLQQAYQELKAEGQRISGRTLAARAHIRRTTRNRWLAAIILTQSMTRDEGRCNPQCPFSFLF